MASKVSVVLVHDHPERLPDLMRALTSAACEIRTARSCQEALAMIDRVDPPDVIFTDVTLPDGTWEDLLVLATKTSGHTNVIVVAQDADIPLYLEVLDRGAFDFMAAPFTRAEVEWVVRNAAEDAVRQRTRIKPPV